MGEKTPVEKREVLKAADVAKMFAVSVRTVLRWLEEGVFESHGIRPFRTLGGEARWYADEVREAIERQRWAGSESLRERMLKLGRVPRAKVICISNQKGGVGKTSISVNLAHALTELTGARVLVLDLDPQGNCTQHFGYGSPPPLRSFEYSMADLWISSRDPKPLGLKDIILPTINERISVGPMDHRGIQVEHASQVTLLEIGNQETTMDIRTLSSLVTRFYSLLPEALNAFLQEEPFDWIFIDTPPTLGSLTVASIASSDGYLVPVEPEIFSSVGAQLFEELVDELAGMLGRNVNCLGYIINQRTQRSNLREEVRRYLRELHGDKVFQAEIGPDTNIGEASGRGMPLALFNPRSRAVGYFADLASEFVERMKTLEQSESPTDQAG